MPEGHTIHRLARLHRDRFANRKLAVSSPQGRFRDGAAVLDGRFLRGVEAAGKHLFYRFSGGVTLHVHLGLFGRFRVFGDDPPPPTAGTRMAWKAATGTLYLAGATIVELIDPASEETIRGRLGPDPLNGDGPDRFVAALGRRGVPIGAALLDQKVVAGIGNVYRSELLFLEGIHPELAARDLGVERVNALWDEAVRHLRRGERSGRIVTVDRADLPDRPPREERLYVYHRGGEPCRRCSTEIRTVEMAGRKLWYCPRCQPR